MGFNFKKISAIVSSILLTGMTVGVAAAAIYPVPFVSGSSANVAIVYGTGAGVSSLDQVQATNIQVDLQGALPAGAVTSTGGEGESEDEVPLGGSIVSGNIDAVMDDDNLPSLLDSKISWDDGDGSDDYNVHEEIRIGTVEILTTLDDEDLGDVAMSNEQGLEYRYVFDDAVNATLVGDDDADDLFLEILGTSYEVTDMDTDSITVSIAEQHALKIGDTVTFDGKTFTVDDIFENQVQINGEFIGEGNTKKIDGVRINVDSIGYHSNSPELSKAILKIGSDISKTYTDGDEYIGEDEDDPLWVWTISDPTADAGYIGVKYNAKVNDADDVDAGDSIKYVGDSYVFPEDFAVVSLDSITDVDYEDVMVTFDQADLYNLTSSIDPITEDADVVIIEAPTDSITVNSIETSKIALVYRNQTDGTVQDSLAGAIEVFYSDGDGDYTPSGKWRFALQKNLTTGHTLTQVEIAEIEIGDTIVDIDVVVADGSATLVLADSGDIGGEIALNLSGDTLGNASGSFEKLGVTLEDADAGDVVINGTDASTKEGDVMNYYGIVVNDVENNANSDEVSISVPNDRVYAQVSVTAGGEITSGSSLGNILVTDSDVSSVSSKNLIVVGGSCINAVAADILGGSLCGAAFTSATGVGSGQYLIQSVASPVNSAKVALLVAGYEAADTQAATQYLTTQTVDTSVGKKYKGTSSTNAQLVVE